MPADCGHFVEEAADGRLVHISEVPSDLWCACKCPGCEMPMTAKKDPLQAAGIDPSRAGHCPRAVSQHREHSRRDCCIRDSLRLRIDVPDCKVWPTRTTARLTKSGKGPGTCKPSRFSQRAGIVIDWQRLRRGRSHFWIWTAFLNCVGKISCLSFSFSLAPQSLPHGPTAS